MKFLDIDPFSLRSFWPEDREVNRMRIIEITYLLDTQDALFRMLKIFL